MPRRSKGPWKRSSGGWWVWNNGECLRLGETKAEAQRAWHLLQAGELPPADAVLFRTIADDYCSFILRMRSRRHANDCRLRLDPFVQAWWMRAAESLRWADVETVLQSKEWNPTTQGNHLTALRSCLRWAVKTRALAENPIPHISIPKAETRRHAMSKEQVALLLKHSSDAIRPILWALSVTGARPGELIAATVEECDEDGTAIRLAESKVGNRTIWFPKVHRPAMAEIRKLQKCGPLFPAPEGGMWSKRCFHEETKEARERAKLPAWATPYTLRHAWITERLRGGFSHDHVAELVGTSVMMIERTYKHLLDGDLKKIADRL